MSCAHPIEIHVKGQTFKVPCRHCLNCRTQYVSQLMFQCNEELYYNYRAGYGASFVTFTYDDNHLPLNASLRKADLQNFIKNIRRQSEYHSWNVRFKYVACGEYGDSFGRPHYHVVFIGLSDAQINAIALKCWDFGLVDVGALGAGGLRYVLKYCCKSVGGKLADALYTDNGLEKPFICHSVKIGYQSIRDNFDRLSSNNWSYMRNGKVVPLPPYLRHKFDKYKTFSSVPVLQSIKREADKAKLSIADYTAHQAYITEKLLINDLRGDGHFVDDSDLLRSHDVVSTHVRMHDLVSNALGH